MQMISRLHQINELDFILFADDRGWWYHYPVYSHHKDTNSQVNVVNEELKDESNWLQGWNGLCTLFGDRFMFFEYLSSIFL